MKDEEELRKMGEGQRKCERILNDEYGRISYMKDKTPKDVRNMFTPE